MLEIVPISFKDACAFIKKNHRHHPPPQGHKFSIGLSNGQRLIGVAISGRPIARKLDNGTTAEVTRLCTDGSKNACSKLYAYCWRVAKAMGYKRIITYILDTETGLSLKAAGWVCLGEAGGGSWNCPSRPRINKSSTQGKVKYMKEI